MTYDKLLLEVLSTLRAIAAKKLLSSGMNQKEVAEKLGITQPAVSQYKRMTRGHAAVLDENPELRKIIEELAEQVAVGRKTIKDATIEVIEICRNIQQ